MTQTRPYSQAIRPGWHLLIALAAMILMGISSTAYPDTYNFFFQKPKKGEKKAPPQESADESAEEEGAEDAEPEKTAPEPKADRVTTKGKDPVIINNYNYNTNDNRPKVDVSNGVTPTAPIETTATLPTSSANSMTIPTPTENIHRWQHWHLGVGGIFIPNDKKYPSRSGAGGVELTLQYFIARPLALSVYGGLRGRRAEESFGEFKLHAGFEAEMIPLRVAATESWDSVQLGILLGGVTHSAARGNIGSLYLGARATLNLNPSFGITAAARANLGMAILQAGFVTSL